jgi:ABC transporter DrrB family efflux protein
MTSTMTPPSTATLSHLVVNPNPWLRASRAVQDTRSILWRDLLRTMRQPDVLAFAVIMGVFFLVLFNYVFGGSIGAGAGIDYLQFLVPGVMVITALQGAQQTSMSLAADLTEGVVDRFRSLPMNQTAVTAGKTLADGLRNVVSLVLVALVALLMGYRFASFGGALAAIALATVIGYGFSWMGAAIAVKVRKPDAVGMLSMFWLFPLMLASTAFTPAQTMPSWLQPFAEYQPISAAADAVRGVANGTAELSSVLLALGWTVLLLIVFVPVTSRLYRTAP